MSHSDTFLLICMFIICLYNVYMYIEVGRQLLAVYAAIHLAVFCQPYLVRGCCLLKCLAPLLNTVMFIWNWSRDLFLRPFQPGDMCRPEMNNSHVMLIV